MKLTFTCFVIKRLLAIVFFRSTIVCIMHGVLFFVCLLLGFLLNLVNIGMI